MYMCMYMYMYMYILVDLESRKFKSSSSRSRKEGGGDIIDLIAMKKPGLWLDTFFLSKISDRGREKQVSCKLQSAISFVSPRQLYPRIPRHLRQRSTLFPILLQGIISQTPARRHPHDGSADTPFQSCESRSTFFCSERA